MFAVEVAHVVKVGSGIGKLNYEMHEIIRLLV